MRAVLLFLLFTLCFDCQGTARQQGSFWFNDQHFLTDSSCEFATIHRISKFGTATKTFEGAFTDRDKDGKTLVTGTYENGKKQGRFRGYFTNGYLKWEGVYQQDIPDSTWYFYYSDGRPLAIIKVENGKGLIIDHLDLHDKQTVKNGT